MDRYAVVVDGYHIPGKAGRGFASAFRDRGILPITVLSTPEPLKKFEPRWFPEDFAGVHLFDGDFDKLLATVKGYDPICIIAGNERGVELTAALVESLMPEKGNVPGSVQAQRHKGQMVRALMRAGVPTLRTISTGDPDAVGKWISSSGLTDQPLVLKPSNSGGTDNVNLIGAGEDWRPCFDQLVGSFNDYGYRNDTVIVQEYAQGTEYIVDLYSVNGRHGLVDVCVYIKHDQGSRIGIYDVADFVAPERPEVAVLADYTMRAADAVGIRNGSTHAEVMLTADGPRLIELGARYSGSCMMHSGSLATGDNQINRTVRHYLDGEFTPGYKLIQEVRTLWLSAAQAGTVRNIEILRAAEHLPTVSEMLVPQNGAHVPVTLDMKTTLGWVIQGGADWRAIGQDYRRIRELESNWNASQADGDPSGA